MKILKFLLVIAVLFLLPVAGPAESGTPASGQMSSAAAGLSAATDLNAAAALCAESNSAAAFSSSADPSSLPDAHRLASSASGSTARTAGSTGSTRPFSGVALGVKFGVAGVGFDVATPLVPGWLNLRGGASFFSYSPNLTVDNIAVNGAIKFQNAAATVDIFPFHGRFRISGGATIYNNTSLAATLTPSGGSSFTLGNTNYTSDPANPATGTGTFTFGGKVAPRVSIGTGNMLPKKGHWTFESEIGVQFISQPTVVYAFSGEGCASSATTSGATPCPVYGPIAQKDITQEENNLQSDLYDLRFFPVLSIGVSYKIH